MLLPQGSLRNDHGGTVSLLFIDPLGSKYRAVLACVLSLKGSFEDSKTKWLVQHRLSRRGAGKEAGAQRELRKSTARCHLMLGFVLVRHGGLFPSC